MAGLGVAAPASAAVFTLGAFENYGILINTGVANADINTFPVNANIGVGDITGQLNLHNGIVNGRVDLTDTAAHDLTGGAITGTEPASLGGPAPASVNGNVAAVGSAIATALSLSSTYGAESGLGTAVTINGTTTINASSGFLDVSGARLFTTSTFNIGNGHTVTINGTASDYVVLDVIGNTNFALNGALDLTGGLISDHVLINFTGTGALNGAANGATLEGTFLAPNRVVGLNSLTLDGRIFGGVAGQDFHFVSNAFIDQPAIPSVPEPGSWALMVLGFGLLGAGLRRARVARFRTA